MQRIIYALIFFATLTFADFERWQNYVREETSKHDRVFLGSLPFPNGTLVISGTGLLTQGLYTAGTLFDSPMKWRFFDIENGNVYYSSDLIPTNYYKWIQTYNEWPCIMLFNETRPPRPAANCTSSPTSLMLMDNSAIVPTRIGEDIYYMTDAAVGFKFNLKDRVPELFAMMLSDNKQLTSAFLGAGHTQHDLRATADHPDALLGVSVETDMIGNGSRIWTWVHEQGDFKEPKNAIGSLHVDYHPSTHSFFQTQNFVIVPIGITGYRKGLVTTQMTDPIHATMNRFMEVYPSKTLQFLVFHKDGAMEPFFVDTHEQSYIMHTFHAQESDDEIILRGIGYGNCNAFDFVDLSVTFDKAKYDASMPCSASATVTEWTVALDTQTITNKRTMMDDMALDFPKTNEAWPNKKRCIGYFMRVLEKEDDIPNYFNGVIKHNWCTGKTQKYAQPDLFYMEPIFVPREPMLREDDGYVLTLETNVTSGVTALLVLEAVELEKFSAFPLPDFASFTTHWGAFF